MPRSSQSLLTWLKVFKCDYAAINAFFKISFLVPIEQSMVNGQWSTVNRLFISTGISFWLTVPRFYQPKSNIGKLSLVRSPQFITRNQNPAKMTLAHARAPLKDEDEIWLKFFFGVFSKNRHPGKLHSTLFHKKSQHGYFYWRSLSPLPIAKW